MLIRLSSWSGLLASAMSLPACAADPVASPAPVVRQVSVAVETQMAAAFRRADRDGDGRLSHAEAVRLPAIDEAFDKLDVDRDGFLTWDEFERAPVPR